jgi:UDP-glucose 4-epimerase
MKILITGGLGSIGGRLGVHLSENGHEIVLGTRKNLKPPGWLPTAKMVMMDWESDESLNQACLNIDLVIHAAGMNADDCELNPVAALNFNGNATSKILTAAVNNGVKTFFYLSTAHVYSNPLQGLVDENTTPTNPHPYATSHLEGEKHAREAKDKGLINSTILRLSNTYGAPTSPEVNCWNLLVNDLCMQATLSKQLRLSTSGKAQRNFITLSDVCNVIKELIYKSESQILPLTLNIGNTYSSTVYEMAVLVQYRCEIVLGFRPDIIINSDNSSQENTSLDFRSSYSNLFQNKIKNNRNSEIDELINFCKKHFGDNSSLIEVN